MASLIFLGNCFGLTTPMKSWSLGLKTDSYEFVLLAFIAKGNIIEGITAKE